MKRLLTLAFLLLSFGAFSQVFWTPAVAVSTNAFGNLHPRVTLDKNGNPLILWGNSGSNKAYFSRWAGSSFTSPVALNPATIPVFAASWAGPDIASHGDTVYAVYKHTPEDTNHIYITRSVDGGQNFAAPVRVDGFVLDSNTRFPTVTTDATGNPIVAFMKFDTMFMNAKWVVAKSTDMGNTFSPDILASGYSGGNVCDCCPGHILSVNNKAMVSYRNNLSNIRTIWTAFSPNNGISFSNGIQADATNWMVMACPSSGPDAIQVGDSMYTVFMSGGGGTNRVYMSKSVVSTQQLASSARLTGDNWALTAQNYPRAASTGNAATIVWKENANSTTRICLKFTDSLQRGFSLSYDTLASGTVENADVAMSPGVIHLVYQDDNSGNVMYRRGIYSTAPGSVQNITSCSKAIKIFPNPAHTYFTSTDDIGQVAACTLIDNNGKSININPAYTNGKLNIPLSGIAMGTYTVLLADHTGQTYSSKLIVE